MKLRKCDRVRLESAIEDIRRGHAFIMSESVAVAKVDRHATTTLHYTRTIDGRVLYEVNKDVGSLLCVLTSGIKRLEGLLNENEVQQ